MEENTEHTHKIFDKENKKMKHQHISTLYRLVQEISFIFNTKLLTEIIRNGKTEEEEKEEKVKNYLAQIIFVHLLVVIVYCIVYIELWITDYLLKR